MVDSEKGAERIPQKEILKGLLSSLEMVDVSKLRMDEQKRKELAHGVVDARNNIKMVVESPEEPSAEIVNTISTEAEEILRRVEEGVNEDATA